MTGFQKEDIQYRKDRAEEVFLDARLLADNENWRLCVNGLYYSLFHLVTALLSLDGITTKTHEGLKTKFLQLYLKTNIIKPEYGRLFTQLMDWRQESDYSRIVDFQEEDVRPLIKEVINLGEILKQLIDKKTDS